MWSLTCTWVLCRHDPAHIVKQPHQCCALHAALAQHYRRTRPCRTGSACSHLASAGPEVFRSRVQETGDGQLAVLHDLQSLLRASEGHSINTIALMELSRAAPDLDKAVVKVCARLLR